jgi:hypothetical protein
VIGTRGDGHFMVENEDVVDLDPLRARFEQLASTYRAADPFPHVVIDDALPEAVYRAALSEFPPIDDASWGSYLHVNETKFANQAAESWGPTLRAIGESLCNDDFAKLLSALTGIQHLIPDPSMDGGGLHQTLRGGHLNIHADFTTHHRHRNWMRRVNVLLYLNDHWSPEWGGALELWDADVRRCVRSVAPLGNRMLIFTTSGDAYHGHPDPLVCPDGIARRSIALYYFTAEHNPRRRSTRYRARPGDGGRRFAIWADQYALSLYDRAKTRLGLSDRLAGGLLSRAHRVMARFRGSARR